MRIHPVIDAIRQARREKGWSQARLAEASGVSVTAIGGWEDGTHSPQLAQLARVLDVLALRLDVLPYRAEIDRPHVRIDPAQRFGQPAVAGVSVVTIGATVLNEGVAVAAAEYGIGRADVLVACWHLGLSGSRRWRLTWHPWAMRAHEEMWHGRRADYDLIPDPPDEPDRPANP